MTRAERRNRNARKYISKLKRNMYYWLVKGADGHWRKPTNWREMDDRSGGGKLLKKCNTLFSEPYDQSYAHETVKKLRQEGKKVIDEELQGDV